MLRTMCLSEELFAAAAINASGRQGPDGDESLGAQGLWVKEELEARDEAKSGSKAWLRRRLHALAIVREHLGGR